MIAPWILTQFGDARVEPVKEGWSGDGKYRITTAGGVGLLRVSPADDYPRKEDEFAQIARLNQQSDAFPRAIDHGLSPDGKQCYVFYQWIEGRGALSVIPKLSEAEQFQHGVTAGKLLRVIHDLPQGRTVDSYAIISAKMKTRRWQMRDHGLEFPGYETMIEFLERHLTLLKDATTTFQHGDFHLGNMLIDPTGRLRVIDFNRSNFGDPMEDFNQMFTFSRRDSIPFARGQLKGYFGELIPDSFYPHALCYIVMNGAFGLVWAKQFGVRETAVQHALVDQIRSDFDGLGSTRPKWLE